MMKTILLGSILLILSAPFSFAQLRWQPADSSYGPLPKGIKLYRTSDSLNGRPFQAWYLEADLNNRQLDFTAQVGRGQRFTPSKYYEQEGKPLVVVNTTFFSFETNQNLNLVIRNGKLQAYNLPAVKSIRSDSFYYPTRGAIGIRKNRKPDVAWVFTDTAARWPLAFEANPIVAKGATPDPTIKDLHTLEYWKKWRMHTAVGGGPVLVKDQSVYITNREEQLFVDGLNDLHPRTAMGYTLSGKLIILVVQGRFPGVAEGASLQEEARILINLGCMEALNLDGGGSSCMLVNGRETIQPSDKTGQRPVPAVFIIREHPRRTRR
ncbi:MAG: phosphodiester glycosidase family protein [Candidatus Pseudobacter hemicellulosilyticus]|uniref:Phosphodiester glycosidase family protein n=1 Tax=Candidatus Pseudobacter hemicellulosilyticus TaxID=3121375 RepID=A0AAJ5WM22_9BACT|nr:MAG: phosphodiester glycosidase family protein [Pseudobacter sp.]